MSGNGEVRLDLSGFKTNLNTVVESVKTQLQQSEAVENEEQAPVVVDEQALEEAQEFADLANGEEANKKDYSNEYSTYTQSAEQIVANADKREQEQVQALEEAQAASNDVDNHSDDYNIYIEEAKKTANNATQKVEQEENKKNTTIKEVSYYSNKYNKYLDEVAKITANANARASQNPTEAPEATPTQAPSSPSGEPENSQTPTVPSENEPTVPNTAEPNVQKGSFDGELSDDQDLEYYTNKMKQNNADFTSIANRLVLDKEISVYDKYKLLQQILPNSNIKTPENYYRMLMDEMTDSSSSYSIDDLSFINSVCLKALNDKGITLEQIKSGKNAAQYGKYIETWVKLYSSSNFDIESLNQIMPLQDLAVSMQQGYSGAQETEMLTKIISRLPQSALNYNEQENLPEEYKGLEEKYSKPKDIFKAYNSGELSSKEVLYILSSRYENVEEMMKEFRKMSSGNEEKYLQDLIYIMQYKTEESAQ